MNDEETQADMTLSACLLQSGLGYQTRFIPSLALARTWLESARNVRLLVNRCMPPSAGPVTHFAHRQSGETPRSAR